MGAAHSGAMPETRNPAIAARQGHSRPAQTELGPHPERRYGNVPESRFSDASLNMRFLPWDVAPGALPIKNRAITAGRSTVPRWHRWSRARKKGDTRYLPFRALRDESASNSSELTLHAVAERCSQSNAARSPRPRAPRRCRPWTPSRRLAIQLP